MQISVAPNDCASSARRTISSMGRKYPSSLRRVRENAQKRHALTQTLVKLTLRLTT